MQKEKVIVTGGAGFIGSNLTDVLLECGYEVHIIDDLSGGKSENMHPKAVFHNKDIRNLADIAPIFENTKFVFHLAALPRVQFSIEHPDITGEVNVMGTQNVLIASGRAKVARLVYSASSSAYGDSDATALHENLPAHPKSPYGFKNTSANFFADCGAKCTDFRPCRFDTSMCTARSSIPTAPTHSLSGNF